MLRELFIKNFALIRESRLEFDSGLTVITGETGAGKSIMLNALGLIMGNRADASTIGDAQQKCIVEATFRLDARFEGFFNTEDLDFEPETIIRRELAPNGKSRAFINDTPVTNKTLKELCGQLLDIHGQQDNQLLLNASYRLRIIDLVANAQGHVAAYKSTYTAYIQAQEKLAVAQENLGKNQQELDFKNFQLQELEKANLADPDELTTLEERQQLFERQEEISLMCQEIGALNEDPINVLGTLKAISKKADTLSNLGGSLEKLSQASTESLSVLQELEALANQILEENDLDEAEYQKNTERIDQLNTLLAKHQAADVADLISFRDRLSEEVQTIANSDEHLAQLEKEVTATGKKLREQAKEITALRKTAADKLASHMEAYLPQLNMEGAALRFAHQALEQPAPNGMDGFVLESKMNVGNSWSPIEKTASGGELARVMLAFKTTLSNFTAMPTLIFDEIDTGLGGETASKMGGMLQAIAQEGQVISITHLAQIAGKGAHHFKVLKEGGTQQTTTHISKLNQEERLQEVARMISGEQISPEALANAKVLLN